METRVPFQPLNRVVGPLHDDLVAACGRVVRSGWFLNGPELECFEEELAERCGVRHVIGVGSGTQALQALLIAYGIGPGDEVVTTAASFYATAKAITLVGATPVFADVRPEDYNLDPTCAAAAITRRTKAILVVHLYGRPVDLDVFRVIANRARVLLLEDAAHALGASVDERPVGSLGDGAALSFYPTKNLGALGDAGAVLVNDDDAASRARAARFLGWEGVHRDVFTRHGISGRMDELQAAFLRVRLKRFDAAQEHRRQVAARYREELPDDVLLSRPRPGMMDANHLFVIAHTERDRLARELHMRGVETEVHYRRPLHRQALLDTGAALPVTERWASEVLSLPLHSDLGAREQSIVIDGIHRALR